jgi:hypothetical protein
MKNKLCQSEDERMRMREKKFPSKLVFLFIYECADDDDDDDEQVGVV